MKKTELQNCPQWLLDAQTINEDVEIINGVLIWKGGIWNGGIWEDGIWEDGTWKGGIWNGGIWERGTWKGGTWERGTWKDGKRKPMCRWSVYATPIGVKIGCNEKTIKEWDDWFASNDVFETHRDSEQFKYIRACYESAKAFKLIVES